MDVETARELMLRLRDALGRQDRGEATATALALLAGEPPLGRQWKALATLLQHNGEVRAARRAMALHSAATGQEPQAVFEEAVLAAQCGAVDAALALLDTVSPSVPDRHAHAYSRGTMLTNLGRFDAARADFRAALDAAPGSGQAALGLVMAGSIAPEDADRIAKAGPRAALQPPTDHAAWHYAHGRVLEARSEADAAFAAYAAGAAIMAVRQPADLAADRAEAEQAMAGWDRGIVARTSAEIAPCGPSRPIFVTGLPRSGTTLVEQILATHSQVDGGEELGLLRLLHQDIGGHDCAAFDRYVARTGTPRPLRALYDHLLGERYPGTGRVVDKSLNTSRSIGLVRALFPDAPIVWVRRDPADCAWSAFRTWFARGVDWSWSLQAAAYHFKLEDALFHHWRRVYPGKIHVVVYERLVADPEQEIRALLEFCGLDFEPAVLEPHRTERTVSTASAAQVREGIHAHAQGSAQAVSAQLKPFLSGYYG